MLTIVGPVRRKKRYTNIPMTDGVDRVTAYARHDQITYFPLGGSFDARLARAEVIAYDHDGAVMVKKRGSGTLAPFVRVEF